jgi:hypothetical protein
MEQARHHLRVGVVPVALLALLPRCGGGDAPCTPSSAGFQGAPLVETQVYTPPGGCFPTNTQVDTVINSEAEFWASYACTTADGGHEGVTSGIDFTRFKLVITQFPVAWGVESGETVVVGNQSKGCAGLFFISQTLVPATSGGVHVVNCAPVPCHCGGLFESPCPV